ncbi:mitochondrial carrier domain-containing protein [Polychytrium aggregatum]|uniref:mitochondrial carrier domain-containing protein n=1 Tax=Polychytrium aggregatum TaxID=110093 RepID=UPI0022FEE622|nr:mitochondrial carrier domain-containing protein [Polychytrium aggregatum]KAI9199835.1 mitochondrial carrier domain-containing protein [Polychytrium aggregatum]
MAEISTPVPVAVDAPASGSSQTLKELFAGSVGGIFQVLVGQPFDTVKVRLQTQPDQYGGMVDCVKKTLQNEGPLAFYKGTLTPLVGIGACVSVQFGALEAAKRYFVDHNKSRGLANPSDLNLGQLFLAGSCSGVANSVLSGPIEHIRTRLQVQPSGADRLYAGPGDFIKKIYGQYGIAGIYKGQGITLVREFSGYGVYFMAYEWLMQRYMKNNSVKRSEVPAYMQCLFGACAGYSLWLAIYPVDSVKSKLQTDAFDPSKARYKGMIDCARKVIREEGLGGLYRGFWPCMLRAGPANAATFVAFEATMKLIS